MGQQDFAKIIYWHYTFQTRIRSWRDATNGAYYQFSKEEIPRKSDRSGLLGCHDHGHAGFGRGRTLFELVHRQTDVFGCICPGPASHRFSSQEAPFCWESKSEFKKRVVLVRKITNLVTPASNYHRTYCAFKRWPRRALCSRIVTSSTRIVPFIFLGLTRMHSPNPSLVILQPMHLVPHPVKLFLSERRKRMRTTNISIFVLSTIWT